MATIREFCKLITEIGPDAAVWIHSSGDCLLYGSAHDMYRDDDNALAIASCQADADIMADTLRASGIEYELA